MHKLTFPLIGVTGRAHAGKDTICQMASELALADRLRPATIACADPLKELCAKVYCTAFDVPRTAFYGSYEDKAKELWPGWSGRKILQHIGTEGFRATHGKVWSQYMLGRARRLLEEGSADVVFVSDVRFVEEATTIQNAGGIIVRVYRKEADERPVLHSSEADCDNIMHDVFIDNEGGDLASLQELVREFLCHLNLHSLRTTSSRLA